MVETTMLTMAAMIMIMIYIYHNNASDNNIDTGASNLLPCILFEC